MKAGTLREKVVILEPVVNTTEYGDNKTEWAAKYATRANVKYQSQNRNNDNNEIFYSTTIEFKVRDYIKVTEWDRILYNDKFYRVLSLIPNKYNREITIVTELVNE